MEFKSQKAKAIILLAGLMLLSGAFSIKAERDVSSVSWPILVNLSHMDFGEVVAGEEQEKTFTVSYSGKGDGEYSIVEKYKPKPDAKVPAGYKGTMSDYCQINHDDFTRCYKNLCPYIEETSIEDEGDTAEKAEVGDNDAKDMWKVILNTPSVGSIAKDGKGGVVSEGGEYGCDLSFNIATIPSEAVCGNGVKEKNEECDDGNNRSGDGCSAYCQIEACVNNREVCDGKDNNCDGLTDNVYEAVKVAKTPDRVFLSDGKTLATAKVSAKDDNQFAFQEVDGTDYIYMDWNLDKPENAIIGDAKVLVKHKEGNIKVALEAWNGMKYIEVCDLKENYKNTEEECNLSSAFKGSEAEEIRLRLRLSDSTTCSESLDWAYLEVEYDKAVACSECGNGKVEIGEECDDGNTDDKDSCSNSCVKNKGSISGCKYNDRNGNGKIDGGEEKLSGVEVQLITCPYSAVKDNQDNFLSKSTIKTGTVSGCCSVVATTTTGSDGCYSFENLKAGSYGVNEVEKEGWEQTYPDEDEYYFFGLCAGECKKNIDFLNHKDVPVCGNGMTEDGEGCDDGNKNNGDGCSCTCQKEYSGGSVRLVITDEDVSNVTEDSARFIWNTNRNADSRVVCSEGEVRSLGAKPDYGYTFSSATYDIDPKVGKHNITIYDLKADTTYHCRVISSVRDSEAISGELVFSTDDVEEVPVQETGLNIYGLTLEGLYKTQADLQWKTNRDGTTCVVYSEASKSLGIKPTYGYDWKTGGCEDLSRQTTSHSISLTGLKPCTTYYFRLVSTNGCSDAVTVEQKVRTMCATTSTYYPRPYIPSTSCSTGEKGIIEEEPVHTCTEKKECAADDEECLSELDEGAVKSSSTTECEECPKCEDTVKTVVEKERYMGTEDWLILFLMLMVIFLIVNKIVSRNRMRYEDAEIDDEE